MRDFRARAFIKIAFVLLVVGLALSCSRSLPLGKDFKNAIFYPGNLDAVVVWRFQLTDREPMDYKPVEDGLVGVSGNNLYVGGRSKILYKLDRKSGKVLKQRKMNQELFSQPVANDKFLYVGTPSGKLFALDKHNLEDIWVYDAKSEILSAPIFDGENLYFITQLDTLTALKADTGEFLWEHKEPYHGNLAIRKRAEPLIVGDRLFQGFTNGTIAAFNKVTGDKLWQKSLGKGKRFDDVNATAKYHNGYIYTASFDNGVYCLDAETGLRHWQNEIISASTPIIFENKLYVTASETGFYCLNLDTGVTEWKMGFKALFMDHLEGGLSEPVVYKNDYIIFSASGTGLYFIDTRNKRAITRFTPGNGITSKPTTVGNMTTPYQTVVTSTQYL